MLSVWTVRRRVELTMLSFNLNLEDGETYYVVVNASMKKDLLH